MNDYSRALEFMMENNIVLNEGLLNKLKNKFSKKNNNQNKVQEFPKKEKEKQPMTPEQITQYKQIRDKIKKTVQKICNEWSKSKEIEKKCLAAYNEAKNGGYVDSDCIDPKDGLAKNIFNYNDIEVIPDDEEDIYLVQYIFNIFQSDFFIYETILYEFADAVVKDPSLSNYHIGSGWGDDFPGLWFIIKL